MWTLNHACEQQVMSISVYAAYAKMFMPMQWLEQEYLMYASVLIFYLMLSVNVDVQAKYSLHCCFAVECKALSQKVVTSVIVFSCN